MDVTRCPIPPYSIRRGAATNLLSALRDDTVPSRPGVRASEHANFMSKVQRELRT